MDSLRVIVMSVRIAGCAIAPVRHVLLHGGWRLASTAHGVMALRVCVLPLRCVRSVKRRICGVRTAETPTVVECVVRMRKRRIVGMVDIHLMRRMGRMERVHVTAAHVRNMMGVMGTIPTVEERGRVCV